MNLKRKPFYLVSLVIVGLLLTAVIGAWAGPGDAPFTIFGVLKVTGDPPVFSVKSQEIVVSDTTICKDFTLVMPAEVDCALLNDKPVEVIGYISAVDTQYYAVEINTRAEFTFSGELNAFSNTAWEIGENSFGIDVMTVLPPFYALGDTVQVIFTIDLTDESYLAKEISVLESGVGNTYSHPGVLSVVDDDTWKIGDYEFEVSDDVKPPFFADGDTVEVNFKIHEGMYIALEVTVLDSGEGNSYSYTGVLEMFTGDQWTVDTYEFVVSDAVKPPFFAEGDTVEVIFHIADGSNVADQVTVLNSGEGNEYHYTGTLIAFTDTDWTVDDYTFILGEGISLPAYFGVNDVVSVTFKIVEGDYMATAVEVIETYVPPKTETERCMNRIKDHPGVLKLAKEVGEDPEKVMEYFCSGYGLGEIKLAFRHGDDSDYTPAMLLALRSTGLGWGELKKMAASMPAEDDQEDDEQETDDTQERVREQHGAQNRPDKDKSNPSVTPADDNNGNNGNVPDNSNPGKGPKEDKSNNGKGPDKDKSNNGKNK